MLVIYCFLFGRPNWFVLHLLRTTSFQSHLTVGTLLRYGAFVIQHQQYGYVSFVVKKSQNGFAVNNIKTDRQIDAQVDRQINTLSNRSEPRQPRV